MNISAGTVVPPAVVLAVAGWSCWTILGASARPRRREAEAARERRGAARARAGDADRARPVRAAGRARAGGQGGRGRGRAKAARGAPGGEAPPPAGRPRSSRLLAAARAAEAKRAASAATGSPTCRWRRPRSTATAATAIIGGRAYVEGETIEGTEPALGPVVLAEVRPADVTAPLRRSGAVVVRFPRSIDAVGRRLAAAPPAAPAGRGEAAEGRGRRGDDPGEGAMKTAEAGDHALILRVLQARGLLDPAKAEAFRDAQGRDDDVPERLLVRAGIATDREIARAYADHLALPALRAPRRRPPRPRPRPAPAREALPRPAHRPRRRPTGETLDLAFATPSALLIVDEVQLLTGLHVRPLVAALSVVEALARPPLHPRRRRTPSSAASAEEFEQVDEEDDDEDGRPRRRDPPPRPAPAAGPQRPDHPDGQPDPRAGHPHRGQRHPPRAVRGRVQDPPPRSTAYLHEIAPPSRAQFIKIVSRFKILAKMDIAEKRVPQDGAIALRSGERADRPPRQHRADRLRREDGHADPRQGRDPAPPHRAWASTSGSRTT